MEALLIDSVGKENAMNSFPVLGNAWYNLPLLSKLRCRALDKTPDNEEMQADLLACHRLTSSVSTWRLANYRYLMCRKTGAVRQATEWSRTHDLSGKRAYQWGVQAVSIVAPSNDELVGWSDPENTLIWRMHGRRD